MKRIMAFFLICVMLLGALPVHAFAQTEEAASQETNAAEIELVEEVVAEEEKAASAEDMAAWQSVVNTFAAAPQSEVDEDFIQEIPVNSVITNQQMNSVEFTEREPNNYTFSADRIYNDYTVTGTISSTDRLDYFEFVLTSSSEVNLLSLSTKRSFMIGILDANEEAVAAAAYLGKQDGYYCNVLTARLPAGTYYVVPLDENGAYNVYAFTIWWESAHTHSYSAEEILPTCTESGYTLYTCSCGDSYTSGYVNATGHTFDDNYDPVCNGCGLVRDTQIPANREPMDMYRMYNPNSGEHFYTGSVEERDNLINAGWNYEGVGFTFPRTTGGPVYRLYDRHNTCEHLYTMDETEKNALIAAGWELEGVAFNSAYETEVPQYRLHNPNATIGAYHFTASLTEKNNLIAAGWEYQGIGWYTCGDKNVA